jgi:hypothetical protein
VAKNSNQQSTVEVGQIKVDALRLVLCSCRTCDCDIWRNCECTPPVAWVSVRLPWLISPHMRRPFLTRMMWLPAFAGLFVVMFWSCSEEHSKMFRIWRTYTRLQHKLVEKEEYITYPSRVHPKDRYPTLHLQPTDGGCRPTTSRAH